MKYLLIVLAIIATSFSCKTKKSVVQADKMVADTMYVLEPSTGQMSMHISNEKILPDGEWVLESILSGSDDEYSRITLNIKNNKVSGNDGCNNYLGTITISDNKQIKFSPLASTKRACIVAAKHAQTYYKLIEQVESYKTMDKYLILYRDSGGLRNALQFVKKEQ